MYYPRARTRYGRAYGYNAELLPVVCEIYLKARDEAAPRECVNTPGAGRVKPQAGAGSVGFRYSKRQALLAAATGG